MSLSVSVESIEELRRRKLVEVYNKYDTVSAGISPENGLPICVDCLVNGVVYKMNAGKLAANTMRDGIDLVETQGLTVMPKIRDFNNVDWAAVPLADAKAINMLQGVDAYGYWVRKGELVDSISSAADLPTLAAIEVSFSVKYS